ncbi:MAG: hypothetical protein IEMM0002_0559 [bacterium]|nr:MAG: hypothetical protein IEMM0002_0559 [bacterium]
MDHNRPQGITSLLFAAFLVSLTAACTDAGGKVFTADTPTLEKRWTWRKTFSGVTPGNLAMQVNGAKILFTLTKLTKNPAPGESAAKDEIVAVTNSGRITNNQLVDGTVKNILFDGSGKKAVIHLEDGRFFIYSDFTSPVVPKEIGAAENLVFSHTGTFLAVKSKGNIKAISVNGKKLWSLPVQNAQTNSASSIPVSYYEKDLLLFPFLEKPYTLLRASQDGTVSLYEKGEAVWSKKLGGAVTAVSSSFLEGGVIAVSTGGRNGKIHFLKENGAPIESVPFSGGALSISCSNHGNICATYQNGADGQRVSVFNAQGKKLWNYRVNKQASRDSGVVVAGRGKVVVAGFEEDGAWSLRAWDDAGKPLWYAPVKRKIENFKISWNARRIAVITKNTLEFYSW